MIRVMLGALFIFSGFMKLTSPYQNFLYVVQSYEILMSPFDGWVARLFPWLEFFIGIFLVLGLWLEWALYGTLIMCTVFIVVVGQAMMRQLPITECGCFGEKFSLPLPTMLVVDNLVWILTAVSLMKLPKTSQRSLDQYFVSGHS